MKPSGDVVSTSELGKNLPNPVTMIRQLHQLLLPPEKPLGPDFVEEVRRGGLRGLRIACWMSMFAGLTFTFTYGVALPEKMAELLPSLAGVTFLGLFGIVTSYFSFAKAHPRGLSVVIAVIIGTLLMASQQATGSHIYGHFGGLSTILLVMAALGTLKPFWVLLTSLYFVLLYFWTGVFLDPTVGWPPAPTFMLPWTSLIVSGMIAIWLASFLDRSRRTQFLLRDELARAFRDLHETQAQLLASEKALTQSQLVAALSHELNNPFGVIISNLATQQKVGERVREMSARASESSNEILRFLKMSQDLNQGCLTASRRVTEVLDRLREFSHLDEAEKKLVDLNQELLKALEMVKSETRVAVRIERDLAALPLVLSHPQKMSMAFASLLRNAFQAVGEGGTIRLSTKHQNSHVEVMIEDNGKGIDPAELKVLFDPKFVPQGGKVRTRWGLATSQQIFLQHKGRLELQSAPGQGTTAKVTLPVS